MNAEFDYLPAAQSVTAPAMPTIKWHIDCVFRARGTISTKPVSDQLQRERRALVRELSQHQVLLNILTDIAGIRDIVDHLEIEPLAWQRRLFEGGGMRGKFFQARHPTRSPTAVRKTST